VHTSWPAEDVEAVCEKAELHCLFITCKLAKRFLECLIGSASVNKQLRQVVIFDHVDCSRNGVEELHKKAPEWLRITTFEKVVAAGKGSSVCTHTGAAMSLTEVELDEDKIGADPKSLFTIIFSSGTSGKPKGVMINKKRWKKDAESSGIALTPNQRAVSYMALAHGADRGIVWQTCFCGGSIGFADTSTQERFVRDLGSIKPEFFLGLSHTWNRFYYDYRESLAKATLPELTRMVKRLIEAKGNTLKGFGNMPMSNRDIAKAISEVKSSVPWAKLTNKFCETKRGGYLKRMAIIKFRHKLGGSLQTVATGGAHTSDAVIDFMRNVCMSPGNEMRVFNSYGATEFPGISKNGAISALVDLKLRDLPDMAYTWQHRFLHQSIISCLAQVFNSCKQVIDGRVRVRDLKVALVSNLKRNIELAEKTLPPRSNLHARFREIIENMSRNRYSSLESMVDGILALKKEELQIQKKLYSKQIEGTHGIRCEIERKNARGDMESLEFDVKNGSMELKDLVAAFRKAYGEKRPRGEILVRMKDGSHTQAYWKDPEKSKETWLSSGGWYCTGDVGELEYNPQNDKQRDPDSGFFLSECKSATRILRIIDRCKNMVELYIRGRSVWVAMQHLEQDVYQKARCVHQICLVADRNQPVMVAIVVPSVAFMQEWSQKAHDGVILSPKEICEDPTFQELVLKQIRSMGHKAEVKDYEMPRHVILDWEPWTTVNKCLSAVGKPKRGYLQSVKYISELDLLYAKDEVKTESSALKQRPVTPKENKTFDYDGYSSESSSRAPSRPRTPTFEEIERSNKVNAMVHVIEACIDECNEVLKNEQKITRVFPKDFPFSEKHKYFEWRFKLEDPVAEKEVNEELEKLKSIGKCIYKNYKSWVEIKQKGSKKCGDAWEAALQESEKEVRSKLKQLVASQAKGIGYIVQKRKESNSSGPQLEMDPLTRLPAKGQVKLLLDREISTMKREMGEIDHVNESNSLYCIASAIVAAMRKGRFKSALAFTNAAKASAFPVDEVQLRYDWNLQRMVLEAICERHSVFCPPHLTFQFDWCWPSEDIKKGNAPAPAMPVGDARVWCFASGRLIEESVSDIGKPRYHILDAPMSTDISMQYQAFFDQINKILSAEAASKRLPARSEDARRALDLIRRENPWMEAAMARDVAHWTHLRHFTKKEFSRDDTPIAMIMQACDAYSDRLALGMPSALIENRHSRVPEYAKIACTVHDSYRWIKYGHLRSLVERIARHLTKLSLTHQIIGISGYNDFEFVLSDLAVSRVSSASVGLHTTYSQAEVERVLSNCLPNALMVTKDLVLRGVLSVRDEQNTLLLESEKIVRGGEEEEKAQDTMDTKVTGAVDEPWSVHRLEPSTSVRVVVVMDADPLEVKAMQVKVNQLRNLSAAAGSKSSTTSPCSTPILYSLLDFIRPSTDDESPSIDLIDPYKCRGVKVPHPLGPPNESVNLFTLMYTSGSSGAPKGVMVSTETFLNDMGEPTSASPLVTVSYIPLSHSSDRVKVWEFLGNGGRIGFANYAASNWRAHEKSKKDGMLESSGAENNVRPLFAQIAHLQPSAMSCPPRIWNGLFHIYRQLCNSSLGRFISPCCDARELGNAELKVREKALDYIRRMFGSRVQFLATGGAPTREEVVTFAKSLFPSATFVDSYGTTEAGAIASNGRPIWSKHVQVRLSSRPDYGLQGPEQGEIQVKSPHLHVGYYKNKAKTQASWLPGGWYATGDLGRMDELGNLHVLERISAVRGLKDGTIVYPHKLMTVFETATWAHQVVIDARKTQTFMAAIVVLNQERLQDFCVEHQMSKDKAISSVKLQAEVLREFHSIPAACKLKGERVQVVVPTMNPWTIENKLLTGSHKKKVNRILEQFASSLEQAYKCHS